jgi:hypothetical protein
MDRGTASFQLTAKPFNVERKRKRLLKGTTPWLIRNKAISVVTGDAKYAIHICGQQTADATWEGWIEFYPTDSNRPVLATEQEHRSRIGRP